MPLGVDLVCFDFSGCGISEGDFVTLGWKERYDLQSVLAYIKTVGNATKVILWGGGQGANTALMLDHLTSPVPVASLVL